MGYSEDEASQKAFTDCYVVNPLMAFAGGAISGGVMGTGGVTVSDFKQNMMTKTEKDVSKILKNAVVPSTEPASKHATPAQTDNKVISTEMSDVGKNETKHSIMRNSKGLYVQADEQVIKSDDDSVRAYEIMNYVKNKVMKGKTVEIVLDDGEKILITGRTAWKLADKGKLNDKLYLVKGNASGVIDEVLQISTHDGYKPNMKEHSKGFASEGFDYRAAYFRDLDGKYYKLTLSVGINTDGKEAYNIGKIEEMPFPDKTVSGSKANEEKVSLNDNRLSQNNGFVNNQFMQNNENVASDNADVEKSTKPLTIEQKIRAFLKSENKRVSTATGKTLTEDAFAVVEPTTRKQKNLVKDCASLGIEARYIKTQNKDIIGTSHNINGAYRDGVIYINEDAQNPYRVVLGHEVTHQIKGTDINAYNALEDIARKHIGESFDNLTLDKQEEAVADFVGAVMDNPRAYKSVFQQNRNLLQRFIEAVDSIIGKFRGTETYNDDLGRMLNDTKAEFMGEDAGESETGFSDVKYSKQEIIGGSGKSYGIGVFLDGNYLTELTEDERKEMVKERVVSELAGGHFVAYDDNNNAINIGIAKKTDTIKKRSGKKRKVIEELYRKNINKTIKQEAVVLIDELIVSARYDTTKRSKYSHDWLDNYGNNNWDYWKVYMQEKNKTVWEATLNIANTANGEKILYDVDPIEMVEGPVKSGPTSTNTIIPNSVKNVKEEISDTTKRSRMTGTGDTSATSEQQGNVIDSNSKVNNYLRRARTMFVNDVEDLMNIPKVLKNNDLKQVFNQLWNEYKESGNMNQKPSKYVSITRVLFYCVKFNSFKSSLVIFPLSFSNCSTTERIIYNI